jgi:fibronectin-binding autotransporter adhesin
MAIQGIQNINIGLPNESAGSDSLFTAFNKAQTNFTNLFDTASPVPIAGAGVSVQQVSNSVVVSANLVAGNNVILTTVDGAIVIDSLGDPANGTITGIIAGTGLAGGGFSDNVTVSLANSGVASGTYSNPTVVIDSTGRITQAANGTAGTVTSVSVSAGSGIQISGSPITTAGTITVTNLGVTRVNAGTGITVSGQTGNVTISAAPVSAVTSVGVSSSQLIVTNSPITSSGTITVDLPANATFSGNISVGNVFANSGNVVANRIVANSGQINGNLVITGNISPASVGKIGGIQPGPGIEISESGLLTIDNANLPISFGDFFANNNVLSIVNEDEDMILQTQGNAEIQLIGDIGFYKPDGIPPNIANRYFSATSDGQIKIIVPDTDPIAGAVQIVGTSSGNVLPPAVAGVMLHITGNNDEFATIYNDGVNNFSNFIGRRFNGNASLPTQVKAGNVIVRFSGTGYGTSAFPTGAAASISIVALEDFTDTEQGAQIQFLAAPVGGLTRQLIANIDVANGVTATKFNTAGTLDVTGNANIGNISSTGIITATGNITGGNLVTGGTLSVTGNANVGNIGSASGIFTANVSAGNILSSGAITSNSATAGVGYRTGAGGIVTQNNSKSDPVTLDKITGEITMNGAQLGGSSTVSFTLNNNTIANTDVIILNQVSDANIGLYSFNGKCNSGNAIISVHNMTNNNRSDAIILRFAVIKGAIN